MTQKLTLTLFTLLLFCLVSCNLGRTIPIKVALVYKTGAQPVARTKFYLLNKDAELLEKEGKNIYVQPSHARYLETLKAGIQEDEIKDYIVSTTTTDFEGNAKFTNVPAGTFYIVGFGTTRSETGFVVWSVKVDTENVKDTILLDQENAFEASNY